MTTMTMALVCNTKGHLHWQLQQLHLHPEFKLWNAFPNICSLPMHALCIYALLNPAEINKIGVFSHEKGTAKTSIQYNNFPEHWALLINHQHFNDYCQPIHYSWRMKNAIFKFVDKKHGVLHISSYHGSQQHILKTIYRDKSNV